MSTQGTIIEIVTFKLKTGGTADEFRPLDKAAELQHRCGAAAHARSVRRPALGPGGLTGGSG
jgi:hypothetical protein